MAAGDPTYILGHSKDELDRLVHQSRLFGQLTEQALVQAGIGAGMRILDVGCGAGDVSFLCGRMAGPRGEVIGVDRSPEAIAEAKERGRSAGVSNVRFVRDDLHRFAPDGAFDAVVGRLVLMYFADPASILRRLASFAPAGGIVAFQEIVMTTARSSPRCDEFDRAVERIEETFVRGGFDPDFGLRLRSVFRDAGLGLPEMIGAQRVEAGPDSPVYATVAGLARSLLPAMEATGVATAAELRVETLAERLRAEVVTNDAVVVTPTLIGAWTRRPNGRRLSIS